MCIRVLKGLLVAGGHKHVMRSQPFSTRHMQDDVLGLACDLQTGDAFVTMIAWCPAAAIPGFILVTYMLSIHPYAIICQVIHKYRQLLKQIAVCYNDQRLPPEWTRKPGLTSELSILSYTMWQDGRWSLPG